MDIGPGTDADLLQRALDGERGPHLADAGVLELVAVLHAVAAVNQAALAPRAEFVGELRSRLLSESTAIADSSADSGASAGTQAADEQRVVAVLRVAARPIRFAASVAAVFVLLGSLVGVVSRSAVPGDALYPIKQALDQAAVSLAGSPFDKGITNLAQAQQHIGEARDLIDRGSPSGTDLSVALDAASDSTTAGKQLLLDVYRNEHRAEALTELADFTARARPQVEAMRPDLPTAAADAAEAAAEAAAAWERLRQVLAQAEIDVLRELASCDACGDRAAKAREQLQAVASGTGNLPGGAVSLPGVTPTAGPSGPVAPGGPGTVTGTPVPGVPGSPLPTVAPSVPGVSVSVPGVPGVTVPVISATLGLPTLGISSTGVSGGGGGVTLPSATVGLPTVGISSSVVVGGGGITLPGATVPLPTITVPLPLLR